MTDTQALRDLLVKVEAGEWWVSLPRPDYLHTDLCWKAFNGSLDAAKALHEAVLPGWEYGYDGSIAWVKLPRLRTSYRHDAQNSYTSRAWLIAILRAMIAQATP